MLTSGLGMPAAVKTSITWPSVVIAFGHELTHGRVNLLGSLLAAGAVFVQGRLDGLKETHVIPDCGRLVPRRAEGEGSGKFGHNLDEALLPVLLLQNVLLARRNEA